jgi:hypothetical protein
MTSDSDTLAIPPALLAEIEAQAADEHRSALDVLRDAVQRYVTTKRAQQRHGRVVRKVRDMSAAELAAIAAVEMDPRHDHLDGELR